MGVVRVWLVARVCGGWVGLLRKVWLVCSLLVGVFVGEGFEVEHCSSNSIAAGFLLMLASGMPIHHNCALI